MPAKEVVSGEGSSPEDLDRAVGLAAEADLGLASGADEDLAPSADEDLAAEADEDLAPRADEVAAPDVAEDTAEDPAGMGAIDDAEEGSAPGSETSAVREGSAGPREPAPPIAPLPAAVEEPAEEGAPAWVMTFGDMMSLLLTFFILLFSMSSVEVEKFRVAAESLREAFGDAEGQALPDPAPPVMSDSIPILSQTDQIVDDVLEQIRQQLQRFVTGNQLEDLVEVDRETEGVFLRIQDATVFRPGAAGIEEEGARVLERLGDITRLIEVPVVVTGHTDDRPIQAGVLQSNWELSAVRAAGVARALVERGQNPALVTVEAFSQYRPVADNDTPEGRAQNRRVELYYSRQGVSNTLVERGLIPDPEVSPVSESGAAADSPEGTDGTADAAGPESADAGAS